MDLALLQYISMGYIEGFLKSAELASLWLFPIEIYCVRIGHPRTIHFCGEISKFKCVRPK